ncbi:MAG: glycosyltransferase [Elusimicrobiaceae bacterium]|nr:glycosyltransferase [Elusimicrobiaceae bacterium]
MPPKISILVPAYNVEKYISRCLDSLVNQTLKEIEIICINDGSTDSTLSIIETYAQKDKRIKIIDKQNEGYGKSMNRGLDMATGEYIGIVESDDFAELNMFEILYNTAIKNNVEVVKSNFYEYTTKNGEKNIKKKIFPQSDCGHVITKKQIGLFLVQPSIWSAIYQRDFLNGNNIRFLESPGASYQDAGFNFKVWLMVKRIYLMADAFLHYRCDNENSSVKSAGKIFCVCDEYDEIERFLHERGKLNKITASLVAIVRERAYMWNLNRLNNNAQKQFLTRFKSDYTKYIANGVFGRRFCSDNNWCNLMIKIRHKPLKYKILKTFYKIIRPIYKTDVTNGIKKYKILRITIKSKQILDLNTLSN